MQQIYLKSAYSKKMDHAQEFYSFEIMLCFLGKFYKNLSPCIESHRSNISIHKCYICKEHFISDWGKRQKIHKQKMPYFKIR